MIYPPDRDYGADRRAFLADLPESYGAPIHVPVKSHGQTVPEPRRFEPALSDMLQHARCLQLWREAPARMRDFHARRAARETLPAPRELNPILAQALAAIVAYLATGAAWPDGRAWNAPAIPWDRPLDSQHDAAVIPILVRRPTSREQRMAGRPLDVAGALDALAGATP